MDKQDFKSSELTQVSIAATFYLEKQPPEVSVRKGVLRSFVKITGKHLSVFFNKVVGLSLRPAPLLKTRPWHRCFLLNFARFLRTPFLQNTSGRLLLNT